jgi:hypothetical protein
MEQPTGASLPVRASDAEREEAARSLGAHLAAGRLTLDEFSERVDRAYRAQTVGELEALSADLPSDADRPPPPAAPRKPFWPGNLPFATRIWTPASATKIMNAAMQNIVPRLVAEGYRVEIEKPTLLVLSRTHRPAWTIAAAALVFPVGALALLHQDRCQVLISVHEHSDETTVEVSGTAPLAVRRAVRTLAME